jgi:hypothetical protein
VEQRGHIAGECDVHGGERLGVAAGELFESGGGHGEHLLRGLLPHHHWALQCDGELFRDVWSGQCAAARPSEQQQYSERAVCIRQHQHISQKHLQLCKLLGGRGVQHQPALTRRVEQPFLAVLVTPSRAKQRVYLDGWNILKMRRRIRVAHPLSGFEKVSRDSSPKSHGIILFADLHPLSLYTTI